jgi:putative endonuclease
MNNKYYYVYVLRSKKDGLFYTGYTNSIQKRIEEYHAGKLPSTKNSRPMDLIYWEGCINQQDATQREKYLKSSWGKRYLKNRLNNYLTG